MNRHLHGAAVRGCEIDHETRCAHYHGANDIVAIKFRCCRDWFPCHRCHAALAGHRAAVWSKEEFEQRAVLCGACGHQLTIREYLACASICPSCQREFNEACGRHWPLYFDI